MKILHNPRCSKSRSTLKMIQDAGLDIDVVLYLDNPPSKSEIKNILSKLGMRAKEIVRFKDPAAKELGISQKDERNDSEWMSLLSKNPALIERPIVVKGSKAVLGRPPENVKVFL